MTKKFFSENEIRPEKFKSRMEKVKSRDIKYLFSKKNRFVKVNCPACGRNNFKKAFKKYGFTFDSCGDCGTVFMNPRATPEILDDFYSQSAVYAYWNKTVYPASEELRREKIVKPRVKRILEICDKFKIPKKCLVEAGAGFGTFCDEVKKTGEFQRVVAIEPSATAKSCRQKGIETIEDFIENIKTLKFAPNVVASFEVIEHLFSPENFLTGCKRLMSKESIIAVSCPNYNGFDILTLGLDSESIDHEHINLFNPDSLSKLFSRCGFEVLECFTPGEIDADIVRNKIISGEFEIKDKPFLKLLLIDEWDEMGAKFQSFLQNNNLSSNMWLVAKNKQSAI
ncbi:MAG: Methyltransferase type 11 [Parcubacteria group bacterium GW2011_GWB1_42_6]|nr:MAG: Methyltransferase type 11 [Parcubacteria group bacterium GW2011_GWB1_42_6]